MACRSRPRCAPDLYMRSSCRSTSDSGRGPFRAARRRIPSGLPRLMALDAGEQFLFQQGPALGELRYRHLVAIEKLDDLVVFVTEGIEARVRRRQPAHGLLVLREPRQQ